MPEDNEQPRYEINWTADVPSNTPIDPDVVSLQAGNVIIHIDNWGIIIKRKDIEIFNKSFTEIADFESRMDSAEQEIERIWSALQGKIEVEEE